MTDPTTTGSFHTWSILQRDLARAGSVSMQATLLSNWFERADIHDRFSAIQLLAGVVPKKLMSKKALATLHAERSPLPEWLQKECLAAAPDPCEAIALMEESDQQQHNITLHEMLTTLRGSARFTPEQKNSVIIQHWDILDPESLYQFNRLATGSLSLNLSRSVWIPAIAALVNMDEHALAYQIEQKTWSDAGYSALVDPAQNAAPLPLPFPSSYRIREFDLTDIHAYSLSWLHAGTEVQLVKRHGKIMLWGRELDDRFNDHAELIRHADHLPDDTVLYGVLTAAIKPETFARFQVLDVWNWMGKVPEGDEPASRREMVRALLEAQEHEHFRITEALTVQDASSLTALHRRCRLYQAQGILLLPKKVPDEAGLPILHWPAAPHRVKAVLLYVQRGDGSEGPQYSFGLAKGRDWVTIARTSEGLNGEERDAIDAFTKANTMQRFGPVRTVKAVQVMELEVDSIRASSRHKSGYLLEGVRIAAWRKDLGTEMADDIGILNTMKDE